jgi:hypothetical protein
MAKQGQVRIVANWKAFHNNAPCLGIQEFPLFTDARLTESVRSKGDLGNLRWRICRVFTLQRLQ